MGNLALGEGLCFGIKESWCQQKACSTRGEGGDLSFDKFLTN